MYVCVLAYECLISVSVRACVLAQVRGCWLVNINIYLGVHVGICVYLCSRCEQLRNSTYRTDLVHCLLKLLA